MATYGNPHTLAPKQCATNIPSWTDSTVTANSNSIRKIHLDELRSYIAGEKARRGLSTPSWTDPTITANSTSIRKVHIDELRTAIETCKNGECSADSYYCPQDSSGAISWSDPTITVNATGIRDDHINEMRTKVQALMSSCICEAEYCQYCADCGYYYQYCNMAYGCACNDHKYSECAYTLVNVYSCGSTNLPAGTLHPYKASSGGNTGTAWDGTVAWAMCNYTPPGSSWRSCEHQGGHNHTDWNCQCNPYTW